LRKEAYFEIAIENNKDIADRVIVVGNKDNFEQTQTLLKKANSTAYDIIVEGMPKNTAAAIAFAALSVHPEEVLLIKPSDQIIENREAYKKAVDEAIRLGCKKSNGNLWNQAIQT
jgi:mannose-1-phosphate guanylyltransferase